MPKKAPDNNTIEKIRKVLRDNSSGLWIRELARLSGIKRSTVSKYVNSYMSGEIEDVLRVKGDFIRIVRLKK